ncbi:hypothetical protein BAC1_01531 [uncultured bacterium]|nr:hypothetical protein BAC1_01531 [uncultured bacterium]
MSNISSETLFHFTNLENLKGILENEFCPRYSIEVVEYAGVIIETAYPMVCFCDIPLSQIKAHLKHYGNYGIGMSREWIFSKKLNPVMYLRIGSDLHEWLFRLTKGTGSSWESANSHIIEITKGLEFLLRHVKPFQGKSRRTGAKIKFYNEREWRYIPFLFEEDMEQIHIGPLRVDQFRDPNCLREHNEKIERFKLSFDPKDIKYIIVNKEREILEMVEYLHKVKSPKYDDDTIKILTSRIITCEQIQKDF